MSFEDIPQMAKKIKEEVIAEEHKRLREEIEKLDQYVYPIDGDTKEIRVNLEDVLNLLRNIRF